MNEILKTAKIYLEKKLSVIPVAQDKKPLISWKEFQTKLPTEEDIDMWFKDMIMFGFMPNIGIITGKISGITVVDVEAGGDISQFPETLTAKTGGGGYHLYYRYHPGIKNLVRIKEFTDIRNDGGYVIAPPSITTLGKYEWVKVIELSEFPVEMFDSRLKQKATMKNPKDFPVYEGQEPGSRNDTMTKYLGKILPMVHPLEWENIIWPHFQEANKKNEPPIEDFELRSIYNSIVNREKISPSVRISKPIVEEDVSVEDVYLMSEVAKLKKVKDEVSFSTGFSKFDEVIFGGFKEGDLVVITGKTGHGKTTFAQTLTYNFTFNNIGVLFFSYEVIISNVWKKFEEMGMKAESIVYSPLTTESGSIDWIEKRILYAIEKFNIKVVVLDHLGFLLPSKSKYDTHFERNESSYLGQICRDLKTLARKNELTIILLVHLKKTTKPTIDDIKDSVGIGQEADSVFIVERLLQKPEVDNDDFLQDVYGDMSTISLVKNRHGGHTPRIKVKIVSGRLQVPYQMDSMPTTKRKEKTTDELQLDMKF